MRLAACETLLIQPVVAKWYRAIPAEYWKAALGTAHTSRTRSRFSPGNDSDPRFEIIYLADSPSVALYEVSALFGPPDRPLANPHQSKWGVIDVDVRLNAVTDLTDPVEQKRLGTSAQELTGNWEFLYPQNNAPTQSLGAALFATKHIEGFLAISAKMPLCKALVIFPQKLRQGSELVFSDAITGKTHRIARPGP
jgi:RES domain-containing protein